MKNLLPEVFTSRSDISGEVWLRDVVLQRGKTYLVEAASGAGKSSLCAFLYGYRRDYKGSILFDDRDTGTFHCSEWTDIRRYHLALLFQELRLFPELTAIENVRIKNRLTHHQSERTIREWFDILGITSYADKRVGQMSYGQQQRVALVRALCQPFDFLLADEPVSHLDEANSTAMGEIMRAEADRQGAGLIITSIGKHIDMNYDVKYRM